VAQLAAQWDFKMGAWPVQVWAESAHNFDPDDNNTGWIAGFMVGKASAPNSFEAGLSYLYFGKDAVFAQLVDSDFAGVTDTKGLVLRAAYAPMKNVSINLSAFDTERNVKIGTPSDFRRVLFDISGRF
jgi:hypothetical protein